MKRIAVVLSACLSLAACDGQSGVKADPKPTPIVTMPPPAAPTPEMRAPQSSADGKSQTDAGLPQPPRRFDFYVLALSWSPSYCAAEGQSANEQQCASSRPYAFVVHGLWPQFERGFPSDCKVDVERVPDDLARSLYDIMPSAGLIGHEWRRHGSCTGLDQQDFFATLRAARRKVTIPPAYTRPQTGRTVDPRQVEADFVAANPGLPPQGVATACDGRYLQEVRICMTKGLQFRACPEVDSKSCRAQSVAMPPVRG